MTKTTYATAPQPRTTMPPGIPYIVGNEAAERFSFYGMKAILAIYMTKHLVGWSGETATLSEPETKSAIHLFVASAYFFPICGALLSDWLLGKYRTILWLSVVYCIGHLGLAVIPGREGLLLGLLLIAIGAGGIKPCVSAHVGDQFGEQNQHLLSRVFGWFYFSINFGSTISTLLIPELLNRFGPHVAFGVPGILMAIATVMFWMGRHHFVHIPPGGTAFINESFGSDGLWTLARLLPVYAFVAIFWSLYDQTGSAWVLQAEKMDRVWLGYNWDSSQIQAANPILVMVLIPLFSLVVYPAVNRVFTLTPLRKIAIGFFLMVVGFGMSAMIEEQIEANAAASSSTVTTSEPAAPASGAEAVVTGPQVNIGWQLLAYVVLTAAEVLVSITALEFSYTQAPNKMKSLVMSLYLLSVSAGNFFTSGVNYVISNSDGTSMLPGASYYWFFTGLMLVASVLFLIVVATYKERTYVQSTTAE
jgi:proton-dependent oligopeptide transporter, POT family